jgi:hypothetical protein
MDSVFFYGTYSTGIAVDERNLANPMHAFLGMIVINLFATILL